MKAQLTAREMCEFVDANLYAFAGGRAIPNYAYCRDDAPHYAWDEATERWVHFEGNLKGPAAEAER
jgi:hypothetical protein